MIKIILTGATGMVGEGVLHECLNNDFIDEILIVNRKPSGIVHPKLREIIHADFMDLHAIEDRLSGFNACFFCLGVSSVGMKEPAYTSLTYTLTLNFAQTLVTRNPSMTFCYVSGAGTDSSEKGNSMWARVKGKTENDLVKLPFREVYNFRPGFMKPTKGLRNTLPYYRYISWLYPLGRKLYPKGFHELSELGRAMIEVGQNGYSKQTIEVKDIVELAKRSF
ncbi:MAG TPA: NAD-dependent epimerase/dehydratase family protein [Flavitalea sp.]|nr:NAD-dependent epimerase/dehydratase family protein [Flavitalea sp.]